MTTWHGPDGIRIEVVVLDTRPRFKVTQTVRGRRYLLGYYSRPRELQVHVDLADLVEVIPFPA